MHDLLEAMAEGTKRDIDADFGGELDTSYDLWMEPLRPGFWVGVIDMGDCGQWAYYWNDSRDEGEWEIYTEADPQQLIDRILRKRGVRGLA